MSLSDGERNENNSVLGVGSRLAAGPAAELVQTAFARELADQLALFKGMSLADMAHTVMLIEAGVIPPAEGASLLSALLALHEYPSDFIPTPESGDLYTNREAWLAARTTAVGWLGAGERAANQRRPATVSLCAQCLLAFVRCADKGRLSAHRSGRRIPLNAHGRLHLPAACPANYVWPFLLGFAYPLLRDLERLQALYARTNQSPAGCGSVNGSRLPAGPQPSGRTAWIRRLGTACPRCHVAARWRDRDAFGCRRALVNLDRLAEDLQIFATAEFDLVELAEGHSRASVIMPQKKILTRWRMCAVPPTS